MPHGYQLERSKTWPHCYVRPQGPRLVAVPSRVCLDLLAGKLIFIASLLFSLTAHAHMHATAGRQAGARFLPPGGSVPMTNTPTPDPGDLLGGRDACRPWGYGCFRNCGTSIQRKAPHLFLASGKVTTYCQKQPSIASQGKKKQEQKQRRENLLLFSPSPSPSTPLHGRAYLRVSRVQTFRGARPARRPEP